MSNWVMLVTVLALFLFAGVTINVGRIRVKSGIKAPDMVADAYFDHLSKIC
jgi:hypothetical protein